MNQDDMPSAEDTLFDELFANGEHVFYHNESATPHVSVDMEKNSRGTTWGVHVSGCESVEQAMKMMDEARKEMEYRFGGTVTTG